MYTLVLIALATFASEDLTCIATGALIAQGKLGFIEGTLACIAGIFVGDLALFAAGRIFGRRALEWEPLARRLPEHLVERGGRWLQRRGLGVVFLSRFTPGLRLPTYFAAGVVQTPAIRFALLLLLAAAVWTPLVIAGARWMLGVVLILLVARHVRFKPWEFWPSWAIYLPLVPYFAWLALRWRSLTLFSAANPGIESGGLAGESKSAILRHLGDAVPAYTLVRPGRLAEAANFVQEHGLPIVCKPDVGERGTGVVIARADEEWRRYLASAKSDVILQKYVDGLEFGVFYCRHPKQSGGRIVSITEKRFPYVTGDGRSTIGQLIAADSRARGIAGVYARQVKRPLEDIPTKGERVPLAEIGSHCRGAIFLDGRTLITPELEAAIDRISQRHPGFYFGRYDVRVQSIDALREDHGMSVIELNGVGAEPTHIYDPSINIVERYLTLARHWRTAFAIGAANRNNGVRPMGAMALMRVLLSLRRAT